jgi:hypothetical protein
VKDNTTSRQIQKAERSKYKVDGQGDHNKDGQKGKRTASLGGQLTHNR